jgi:hypothetical protein
VVCFGWIASAQSYDKCAVCQQPLTGQFYLLATPALAAKQPVCESCTKIETLCFGCGLPVKNNFVKMEDGRLLCEKDARTAVLMQPDAQRVFEEAKRDLLRLFSGFGASPNRNVTVHLVDGLELQRVYKSQRSWHDPSLTVGLTQTRFVAEGELEHTIYVLKGMGPTRLMAVYAHEYAHAWLHENLNPDRKVEANTVEGFCEVVAYKLMAQRNQEVEKKVILANAYTRGQVNTLLKAQDDYQFYRLVDWMKTGVDTKIEVADTSRVLAVKAREAPTLVWQPQVTTPAPETLTLRGISGTPNRRFALVNDRTLTKNEVAKVRIGNTNVAVRCLEISQDRVILQINDSPEKTELRLKSTE